MEVEAALIKSAAFSELCRLQAHIPDSEEKVECARELIKTAVLGSVAALGVKGLWTVGKTLFKMPTALSFGVFGGAAQLGRTGRVNRARSYAQQALKGMQA